MSEQKWQDRRCGKCKHFVGCQILDSSLAAATGSRDLLRKMFVARLDRSVTEHQILSDQFNRDGALMVDTCMEILGATCKSFEEKPGGWMSGIEG